MTKSKTRTDVVHIRISIFKYWNCDNDSTIDYTIDNM